MKTVKKKCAKTTGETESITKSTGEKKRVNICRRKRQFLKMKLYEMKKLQKQGKNIFFTRVLQRVRQL